MFKAFPSLLAMAALVLPSAADIEVQIHSDGARERVRKLWANAAEWETLLRQVQSGNQAWLKVAVDLKPGTDAGSAETLKEAVSLSIQHAPEQFLSIAWPTFAQEVCHDLQIEPSPKQHAQFIDETRKALKGVKAAALISQRDSCLRALEQ